MKTLHTTFPIIVALVATICLNGFAQDNTVSKQDTTQPSKAELIRANTSFKPILGIGTGFYNYFGEINHNPFSSPHVSSYGAGVYVSKAVSPSFAVDFNFTIGRLTATEKTATIFRNFRSDIETGSVSLTYNFARLLKPDKVLNPFVSAGVGYLHFDTKSDMEDGNGIPYHYWTDGSLRSLPQDDPLAENATILHRDYVYETDLRQANLDSLGKYSQSAITFPFSVGLNFKVSPRTSMRLTSTYYYNLTDLIDNYTSEGVGDRKGDDAQDAFLYTTFSLHFDLFSPKVEKKTRYDDIDFTDLVPDDADKDGISDDKDNCPDSPASAKVDENGCPEDGDKDGVPDYKDEEPNSAAGSIVDANGRALTDGIISEMGQDTLATEHARIFEVYPSMRELYKPLKTGESKRSSTSTYTGTILTEDEIALVDANKDGILTPEEVEKIIDEFFEGLSPFTAKEILEIIDYLFEQ